MLIYVKGIQINFLIYVNFMLIYVNITDRQTDKHIKCIVRNLTISIKNEINKSINYVCLKKFFI